MTAKEFSQSFDALVSAYNNSAEFGSMDNKLAFDEYEKSVFLTKSQDELIVSIYSGKGPHKEGFEYTEEVRRYLSSLVITKEKDEKEASTLIKLASDNSHIYELDNEVWFITYEALKITATGSCLKDKLIKVVPATQDDLHGLMENPFRGPNNRRALRLDISNNYVEIIHPLGGKYIVRYIKEPGPIIVDTLDTSLDIKGKSEVTECTLHKALHGAILERAVQLAILSRATASQQK